MKKYVYAFEEGNRSLKKLLGGKGANLAEMRAIGLPVPPGFTITTEACIRYYDEDEQIWDELQEEIDRYLEALEEKRGKKLGDPRDPLLVSVRSGAAISMPGMMDTVLNLGLTDESVGGLKNVTGDGRFAKDAYRRFIQMFGDVVLGIKKAKFDAIFEAKKEDAGRELDTELTEEDLDAIIEGYKALVTREKGFDFPQEPKEQLLMAIRAVFSSWNNERARIYREINHIPHAMGTAVTIQSMVFGNLGETSGTGVAFTRNPATGTSELYGEFLLNAQGEDVVAGIRTPKKIEELGDVMPEVYEDFVAVTRTLEDHFKNVQDIEFTIESGELYLLQTRNAKRTAQAAVRVAVDLFEEGKVTKEEALMLVDPDQLDQLLHPGFDTGVLSKYKSIAKGLPASPGAAVGKIAFTNEEVLLFKAAGEKSILVRTETSPEDIEGMVNAEGILTSRGGMTSHAAVVARGMGKCCVAGCHEIKVNESLGAMTVGDRVFQHGDTISLDGSTGAVYDRAIETHEASVSGEFAKVMRWADEVRRLNVRTNADTPKDAQAAIDFGAEGIGLCRTEHMFFDAERILHVRQMILASTREERERALTKILPFQQSDFQALFEVMGSRPVNIRLLDPPLHEFIPQEDKDIKELAKLSGKEVEEIRQIAEGLREFNPMLGHRGCRLAITYPEIAVMQTTAIIEAACAVKQRGIHPTVEIMVPLVGVVEELINLKKLIVKTADAIIEKNKSSVTYSVGTMIEVPRAALTADQIAKEADFFSFGTNDLTQMTFGYSRDDAGKFIEIYKDKNILAYDPFQRLDTEGVGELMRIAVDKARSVKKLKIGICGEHGGNPPSIDFCDSLGFDYVSCSPYRVPIARLAAAQAAIRNKA